MGKVVDITDKLKFEENPALVINRKKYEVNADATTMIEVLAELGDGGDDISPKAVTKLCDLVFTNKAQKDLEKLHLKFEDYVTVVQEAVSLITGDDDDEEESGE